MTEQRCAPYYVVCLPQHRRCCVKISSIQHPASSNCRRTTSWYVIITQNPEKCIYRGICSVGWYKSITKSKKEKGKNKISKSYRKTVLLLAK
jgi:hypothetical protein